MADSHVQKHPYHLVDPSPWPLIGAVAAFLATMGTVLFMHDGVVWVMALGLVLILLTMAVWWRDVIREAEHEGHHTPPVQIGLRFGMALFIASEVMFFSAFFWAFFDGALFFGALEMPGRIEATGGVWPPTGIEPFEAFGLPFLNTLILLLSGVTVTWAHHSLLHGDRAGLIQGLACTVALGALFTGCQIFEYSHAAFGFREGIYPSTFFMATGFHGFHVIIGTCFLTVCLFRAIKGHFRADQHFGFEAAAWYWHFVDVVWLFLFSVVYIWGS